MARVYATSVQYATYTGQAAPADIDVRLRRASAFLDAKVLRLCWYEVDEDGLPTNALVAAAFADATCAQVEWGVDIGDINGSAAVGWSEVEIGTAKLGRSETVKTGEESPARQIAPAVWDALYSPDLTPDVFRLGLVKS
ncbi:hypothetical protein [Streptomyces sp. NPDC013457]|uniref:hypothetical protein n=1 Tax=Streptomyces sp. NPDC013457 TaxID=3364866 RepID=UPI0036FBA36B